MKGIGKLTNKLIVLFSVLILCACNGDEETVWGQDMNMNAVRGFKATVTINNNVHEIVSPFMAMHTYSERDKFFTILITFSKELNIFVDKMPDNDADLNSSIKVIEYVSGWNNINTNEIVSGSAKVIENDGKYITINFSHYKSTFLSYSYEKNEDVSQAVVIDGKIKFLIEQNNVHSLRWGAL